MRLVSSNDTFRKRGADLVAEISRGTRGVEIAEANREQSDEEREYPGQPPQYQKADNEQRHRRWTRPSVVSLTLITSVLLAFLATRRNRLSPVREPAEYSV